MLRCTTNLRRPHNSERHEECRVFEALYRRTERDSPFANNPKV